MKTFNWIAGGMIAFTASAAVAQPATAPAAHDQHHPEAAMEKAPAGMADAKCCCEEMMHKMMLEMMQKHPGMGMQTHDEAPQPQPDHAH